MSDDESGHFVPLGIESTVKALRSIDELYRKAGFHSSGDAQSRLHALVTRVRGEGSQGAESDASAPAQGGQTTAGGSGVTPEVLYQFFRGEIQQYERLAGLGFRFAESLLQHVQRTPGVSGVHHPSTVEGSEIALVGAVGDVLHGVFRVVNDTASPVDISFGVGEFAHAGYSVRLDIGFDSAPRSLAARGERMVTFAIPTNDRQPGRIVGEIYARIGARRIFHRVIIELSPRAETASQPAATIELLRP